MYYTIVGGDFMIYYAIHVSTQKTVEEFDSSKHTEEELKKFRNRYPSSEGFTILNIKEVD